MESEIFTGKEETDKKEKEENEEEENEEDEEIEEEEKKEKDEEKTTKKCSLKDHKEINATIYCQECKIYMCDKCQEHHSQLFKSHHSYSLDKDTDIFTGMCKEKNHSMILDYFCKTHNQLCCAACLCKIKGKGSGIHANCDVCFIKKIKNKKKSKLKENIKFLEDLSLSLEKSLNELKNIFAKINENKEKLKLDIQNIFKNIQKTLNEREQKLLKEVDKQYNNIFFKEDLIKEGEKLPNKIKLSLEKGKKIDKEWDDKNKLKTILNDCVNIENNIRDINEINDSITKCNLITDLEIKFSPEKDGISKFLDTIKAFGKIYYINFKFKECPNNVNENKKYEVFGEKKNIITKTGTNGVWTGVICENQLQKSKIYKWKINILKSYSNCNYFKIGVAPIDFDINSSSYNYGWYIDCSSSCLYSGEPQNYNGKLTFLSKPKEEIIVVMDMNQGTLKFIIDNEDNGVSYSDIPLDKPLTPAVFIYYKDDSISINEC